MDYKIFSGSRSLVPEKKKKNLQRENSKISCEREGNGKENKNVYVMRSTKFKHNCDNICNGFCSKMRKEAPKGRFSGLIDPDLNLGVMEMSSTARKYS